MKALNLVLQSQSRWEKERQAGLDDQPITNGIVVSNRGEPWDYVFVGRDSSGEEIQILLDREWGDSTKRVTRCSLAKLTSGSYRILQERSEYRQDGKLLLRAYTHGYRLDFPLDEGLRVIAEGRGAEGSVRLLVLEKGVGFSVTDPESQEATLFVEWDGERLHLKSKEQAFDPRDESLDGAEFL